MTPVLLVLLFGVVTTGITSLFLLYHRNGPALHHVHLDVPHTDQMNDKPTISMLEDREYSIKWPDLAIAFEKDERSGVPFLVWRGASQSQRKLLFVFHYPQSYSAFMHAISHIFTSNACPANAFEVLQVKTGMHLNEEILYRMKVTGSSFYGVIVDDSGFINISDKYPLCAMIGTGSLSYMHVSVAGDTDEYDWLVEQKPTEICPLTKTEERVRLLDTVSTQLHLKLNGMTWIGRTERLLQQIPVFYQLFYPRFIHDGDTLTVFDENLEQVEKDVQILCQLGQKNSIILSEKEKYRGFSDWMVNHGLYDRVKDALQASDHLVPVIPYRMALSADQDIHVGCSVIHFAPLVNGQIDSSSQTICFYEKLLLAKTEKSNRTERP